MAAPNFQSRLAVDHEETLSTETSLTAITGISDRVAETYASDGLESGSRLGETHPDLLEVLQESRNDDLPRFEQTRRFATAASEYFEEPRGLFGPRDEGLAPVRTVGEFFASTASTNPVAKSYRSEAGLELRRAALDTDALGIPSERWRQCAALGKGSSDIYTRDLSTRQPPPQLGQYTAYWDPDRVAPPFDTDGFVPASDISEPVTIDGTEYVVLTAGDDVLALLDDDTRSRTTYCPVQAARLEYHASVTRTNYADPTTLGETVSIATEDVQRPNVDSPEHVGAVLSPGGDGYATEVRSNRQSEALYGIRESLLFDRLANQA